MRHYNIGKIENKNSKWELSFYHGRLIKNFNNEQEATKEANEELLKFVNFCNEGAVYQKINGDEIIYHQNDIEDNGYEEYEVTYDEYWKTHFFYATKKDLELIGKTNGKVTRNEEQESWYQEELGKIKNIKKLPTDKIHSYAKKMFDEMSEFEESYVYKNIK